MGSGRGCTPGPSRGAADARPLDHLRACTRFGRTRGSMAAQRRQGLRRAARKRVVRPLRGRRPRHARTRRHPHARDVGLHHLSQFPRQSLRQRCCRTDAQNGGTVFAAGATREEAARQVRAMVVPRHFGLAVALLRAQARQQLTLEVGRRRRPPTRPGSQNGLAEQCSSQHDPDEVLLADHRVASDRGRHSDDKRRRYHIRPVHRHLSIEAPRHKPAHAKISGRTCGILVRAELTPKQRSTAPRRATWRRRGARCRRGRRAGRRSDPRAGCGGGPTSGCR